MVVVMRERASDAQVQSVIAKLTEMGFDVHRSTGALRTVLGAVGGSRQFDTALLEVLDGVQEVHRITEPYKLASRTLQAGEHRHHDRRRPHRRRRGDRDGRAVLGRERGAGRGQRRGGEAGRRQGPARRRVQAAQQPVQLPGPRRGRAAAAASPRPTGTTCKLISEVMDISQLELIERYADILQVGARNMQNFTLLRELGHSKVPVMLKRGISATIEEWLLSAEYILVGRQHERDAVRARHPHLRELHPQHARHLGDPGHPAAQPPADHRRSEPRDRQARQGGADGARRGRRRRATA